MKLKICDFCGKKFDSENNKLAKCCSEFCKVAKYNSKYNKKRTPLDVVRCRYGSFNLNCDLLKKLGL